MNDAAQQAFKDSGVWSRSTPTKKTYWAKQMKNLAVCGETPLAVMHEDEDDLCALSNRHQAGVV